MNTRTGEIAPVEDFKKRLTPEEFEMFIKPIDLSSLSSRTRAQYEKTGRAWISRNSKCPYGSWKRFKNCCMSK